MPKKKWQYSGCGPEGHKYYCEVGVLELKKGKKPEPPPNFTPGELATTSDENHPPILTPAQGYAQAREDKEID